MAKDAIPQAITAMLITPPGRGMLLPLLIIPDCIDYSKHFSNHSSAVCRRSQYLAILRLIDSGRTPG